MLQDFLREIKASMSIFAGRRGEVYGVLAEFSDPLALFEAARAVREAGYRHFDAHSPFPIHGMDRAMGLGNSKVGYITLGGGLTGLAVGTWLQWWTGGVDYPINISGKPFFAFEPSIPIMFEVTILFSALAAVTGMFLMNGLPRPYNPLFYSKRFARVTDDAFFLHIAASDKKFDEASVRTLLGDLGALHVETVVDLEEAEEM
jgi:hypothetical protein